MKWLERILAWRRRRREFNHRKWLRRNGVVYTTRTNRRYSPHS